MGCGSSKPKVHPNGKRYRSYDLPRVQIDTPDNPPTRAEFPLHLAKHMVKGAPAPSHNKAHGRRPHAHFDREDFFLAERRKLTPLPGVAHNGRGPAPVLWAYPATDFDYDAQNSSGSTGKHPSKSPGPHRIITDRHKNIKGMVTHPLTSTTQFVRVPEQVYISGRKQAQK